MNRLGLVLSVVVLAILGMGVGGAAASPKDQLSGMWVGDADTALQQQGLTSPPEDPAVQMLVQMIQGMRCEFRADEVVTTITIDGEEQVVTTRYEVAEEQPDRIFIVNLDGPKQGVRSEISFLDANRISIVEEGGAGPATYLKRDTGAAAEAPVAASAPAATPATEAPAEPALPAASVESAPAISVPVEPPVTPADPTAAAMKPGTVVVIIPEQIDTEWFWYYYTEISQYLVQAAVEKALMRAGFEVMDPATLPVFQGAGAMADLLSKDSALAKARAAGAEFLVLGRATATMSSRNMAYGVTVIRSKAEATARVIRVADGQIVALEEAGAESGGQAQKAAGQEALKKTGAQLATLLVKTLKAATAPAPATGL